MDRRILHRLLLGVCAVIGVLLALAIGFLIVWQAGMSQNTVSLADRVDAERGRVFIRSSDPKFLASAANVFMSLTDVQLTEGDFHELAIVENGSGATAWVTAASEDAANLLLPIKERKRSLGYASLVGQYKSHLDEGGASAVWFRPSALPLPDSMASALIASMIGPTEEMLFIRRTPTEGTLILPERISGSAFDIPLSASGTLFSLSLSQPATMLRSAFSSMRDERMAEGMSGILQSMLKRWTGRTDVEAFMKEMLAGPVTVTFTEDSFAVSGTADSARAIDDWMRAIAEAAAEGSIRRQQFYGGENTRTDVVGTGSSLALATAVSGRKYAIADDQAALERALSNKYAASAVGAGTLDIAWTMRKAAEMLPFLNDDLDDVVRLLLGQTDGTLSWTARNLPSGAAVDWKLVPR